MNMIKLEDSEAVPDNFTGVVEWEGGNKDWCKNGRFHREDGPARIYKGGFKVWWLDGQHIWNSYGRLDLINKIILSKTQHPLYPTVQIWKILGKNGLYEQIMIPGMEEFITE